MLQVVDKLVKQHHNISQTLHKKVQNLIVNIITSNKYTNEDKMLHIDELLTNYKRPLSADRQDFILQRLTSLLEPIINKNGEFSILDIGGGNVYILSQLGQRFNLQKYNLICLENNNESNEFKYNYNLKSIEYSFEPNNLINSHNKFDLVICMVSLHHMNDEYIKTNILPLIKKGTYLLIKEHDAYNEDIKDRINWEHHIYHILETSTFLTKPKIKDYLDNYVGNYKSKTEYQQMFEENGFQLVNTYNNLLEQQINNNFENKTVTKLFWQLYSNKLNF
jgi:2-polyprenyl-3-methyl-5-hydroxy-6-metoxy-1,4-benzoquinol methylase